MSLDLENGIPIGVSPIRLKTRTSDIIHINGTPVPIRIFLAALARLILDGSNLDPDDPRLLFSSRAHTLREAPGFNPDAVHWQLPEGYVISEENLRANKPLDLFNVEICSVDLVCAVTYVLTNTDITEHDERIPFIKWLLTLDTIPGDKPNTKQIVAPYLFQ